MNKKSSNNVFISLRSLAMTSDCRRTTAPGNPFMYQPKCLRMRLAPIFSPLDFKSNAICRRHMAMRSSASGSGGRCDPFNKTLACLKNQGLPNAARATMTASQLVALNMRKTSSGFLMSPLPITGIETVCFNSLINSHLASPL